MNQTVMQNEKDRYLIDNEVMKNCTENNCE